MRNIKDAMKDKAGIKIEHIEAEEEPLEGLPKEAGFYMPGEFEPQDGVILIWPTRPGSWPFEAKEARKVFAKLANKMVEKEKYITVVHLNIILV